MAVIEAISTNYLEADHAQLIHASIPVDGTYEHLQLRASLLVNSTTQSTYTYSIFFNNDRTTANWAQHNCHGSGTTEGCGSATNGVQIGYVGDWGGGVGPYSVCVVDILDYADTTHLKVARTLSGSVGNDAATQIAFFANNVWHTNASAAAATDAITQIELTMTAGTWLRGSTSTLYGITGE